MGHFTYGSFWDDYRKLPAAIRRLADKNFALLNKDPQHPSLHFKKVGRYGSARVGSYYRAVGIEA